MPEILQTGTFRKWAEGLRDRKAAARIQARIRMLSLGHAGDAKSVGGSVRELRIDLGPGYRVYYAQRGELLILLLCGGDKSTQQRDIERAQKLLKEWK